MKTLIRTLAVFGVLAVAGRAQTTVDWDFSGGGGSGAPIPTLPANVFGGTIAAFNEYPGNNPGFNSAFQSGGYAGASGNHNADVGIVAGSLNVGTSTYFEFTLTPAAGYQLEASSFQLGSRSNAFGPTTLTLLASVDSYTTPLWTATVRNDSNWALITGSWNVALTGPLDAPITFRLYGSDGIGNPVLSNWRIDDVSMGVVAVPEPPTYAAMLLGAALLGLRALRRRKSRAA